MTELVERVARALQPHIYAGDLMSAARAAIEAMRELTPEMIEAGREEVFKDRMAGSGNRRPKADVAIDTYSAMIDAGRRSAD